MPIGAPSTMSLMCWGSWFMCSAHLDRIREKGVVRFTLKVSSWPSCGRVRERGLVGGGYLGPQGTAVRD